ncbi:hypothetical protein GQ42DRAFT_113491, partial [Ramicandelaber brevisporus]
MPVIVGLVASVLGNSVIGIAQCMQKYALNRLSRAAAEEESRSTSGLYRLRSPSSTTSPLLGNESQHHHNDSGADGIAVERRQAVPRYADKLWLSGLLLNYCGELFGNSVALSYLSTAIVAPLGIVSVLVNLLLAQIFLGETITRRQQKGCAMIIAGVFTILAVAPRGDSDNTTNAASGGSGGGGLQTADDVLALAASLRTIATFGGSYIVIGTLIYIALYIHESLFILTVIASLFGALNVSASKMITTYLRLAGTHNESSVSSQSSPDGDIGALGAIAFKIHHASYPQLVYAVAAVLVLAISITGQETFRQRALGKYPVLEFQPLFFAVFNTSAVAIGVYLFRELHTLRECVTFGSFFAIGLWLVVYGSRFLPAEADSAQLPS